MTVNIETPNRHYPQPHPDNVMKTVDVPRLILALEMLDADMAAVFAAVAGKAPSEHQHAMTEIIGLVAALSGKAPTGHNHGIGTLTGVDLSSAANGQFMKFNGTLWIPAFISAADLGAKIITDAHLRDSNGVTVLGRSVATPGRPADISALMNDRLLARVGDALAFVQMTIGMVPDNLLTFAKLATGAFASQAEAEAGAASNKLMTPLQTAQAIAKLAASQALKITIFNTGGTWTKDPKARYCRFILVGGSGGSGGNGSVTYSSGPGGSAGNITGWYNASEFGASEAISIGSAGSAGIGNNDGGNGGASSIGSKLIAGGGGGGKRATGSAAGANGTPGTGSGSVLANLLVDDYGVGVNGGSGSRTSNGSPGQNGYLYIWEAF